MWFGVQSASEQTPKYGLGASPLSDVITYFEKFHPRIASGMIANDRRHPVLELRVVVAVDDEFLPSSHGLQVGMVVTRSCQRFDEPW